MYTHLEKVAKRNQPYWTLRIMRKMLAKGLNPTAKNLKDAAWRTSLYALLGDGTKPTGRLYYRYFGATRYESASFAQLLDAGDAKRGWFDDKVKERRIMAEDDYILTARIPYTCQPAAYDPDVVALANYKYLKEEYSDLFGAGVLLDATDGVLIAVERRYHDRERMLALCEELHTLHEGNIALHDQYYTDERQAREEETVLGAVDDFVGALDLPMALLEALIPLVTGETKEEYATRKSTGYRNLTHDQKQSEGVWDRFIASHMWDLIRREDSNIEFGDDPTYLDVARLAKSSPLYELGKDAFEKVDVWTVKIELEDQLYTGLTPNPEYTKTLVSFMNDLLR